MTNRSSESRQLERGQAKKEERKRLKKELKELELNQPMIITSGYRHAAYNQVVGGARNSPHLYGKAVDIACYGKKAFNIIKLAMKYDFTGIGVKQNGPHENRFIHLDTMSNKEHPRPFIWSYK